MPGMGGLLLGRKANFFFFFLLAGGRVHKALEHVTLIPMLNAEAEQECRQSKSRCSATERQSSECLFFKLSRSKCGQHD